MPPSEVARAKWAQAQAATSAGASAWQNGLATQAGASSYCTDRHEQAPVGSASSAAGMR